MSFWHNIYKLNDKLVHVLVIVILSVLCLSFNKLTDVNLSKLNLMQSQYFLDAYHTKLTIYSHGQVNWIINGDTISFQSDNNNIHCLNCELVKYNDQHILLLNMVADQVYYNLDQRLITADGNVVINNNNINAVTNHMIINTDTNIASGDSYINITQQKNSLSGLGFDINYDKQIMHLKSCVHFKQ